MLSAREPQQVAFVDQRQHVAHPFAVLLADLDRDLRFGFTDSGISMTGVSACGVSTEVSCAPNSLIGVVERVVVGRTGVTIT